MALGLDFTARMDSASLAHISMWSVDLFSTPALPELLSLPTHLQLHLRMMPPSRLVSCVDVLASMMWWAMCSPPHLQADTMNHRIRVVNVDTGHVSTVAGCGESGFLNGDALCAKFKFCLALFFP